MQYSYGILKPEEKNKILAKLLEVRKKAIDEKKAGYRRSLDYDERVKRDVARAWLKTRHQAGAIGMPPGLPWMAKGPKPIDGIVIDNAPMMKRDPIEGPWVVKIA